MTSVIFVHGTGGRQKGYAATFQQIEKELLKCRSDAKLIPCLWGNPLGAKLNAEGASIPAYDESQGGKKLTPEEEKILVWEALYKDPFYEIRLLGLRPLQSQNVTPGRLTPSQELKGRVANLTQDETLKTKIDALDFGEFFGKACQLITESRLFGKLLETSARPLDGDYAAIARAIVAMSGVLYEEKEWFQSPLVDEKLRDEAVDAILKVLTCDETSRGIRPLAKLILEENQAVISS